MHEFNHKECVEREKKLKSQLAREIVLRGSMEEQYLKVLAERDRITEKKDFFEESYDVMMTTIRELSRQLGEK